MVHYICLLTGSFIFALDHSGFLTKFYRASLHSKPRGHGVGACMSLVCHLFLLNHTQLIILSPLHVIILIPWPVHGMQPLLPFPFPW